MHNILVVEDEPDIGFLIMKKFRKHIQAGTLSFWFASNGEEAIDLLTHTLMNRLPAIALVDINMPRMDGLTFLACLREEFPSIKAIMITAYGDMANIRQAMNLGAFDFLQKPIDFNDLEVTMGNALQDIIARQTAEQENRYLRAICEQANFGAAMSNLAGMLLYTNPYFARIHGYEPEELLGQQIAIFHTETQMQQVHRILENLHKFGSFSALEVWHVHRDGMEFPMLMNGVLVKDEEGHPQFMVATAIDIREYKQAETTLRKSETKYRALAEQFLPHILLEHCDWTLNLPTPSAFSSLQEAVAHYEKLLIAQMLALHKDDHQEAAKALGVSLQTLRYRLKKYQLT
jgi:PAS domain S-box-containing protein